MRRFDTFMFNDELDVLECRLTELDDIIDTFVLVEATHTHGGNRPKPLHYRDNQDRYARWKDRICHVVADELPDLPDAWSREHGQREWIRTGLERCNVEAGDIILQSDVDEIPRADAARWVNPHGFVVFEMLWYSFCVDWLHPDPWRGTVAARYQDIPLRMATQRDARLYAPTVIPDAGWHLGWLGGPEAVQNKLESFCHPEIDGEIRSHGWEHYIEDGWHVDNRKLIPVEHPDLPRWVAGNAPGNWWRNVH